MMCFQGFVLLLSLAISYVVIEGIGSTCEVPTSWQNKSWYIYRGTDDPRHRSPIRRQISIGVSEISGFIAVGYAATTTNWTCYLWNETQRLIAFKGDTIVDNIGTDSFLYAAFQLGDSFNLPVLFPRTSRDVNVYDDFVKVIASGLAPTMEDIATKPAGDEFYFMLESDTTASQLQAIFSQNLTAIVTTATVTTTQESTTLPETVKPSVLPKSSVSDVYKAAIIFSVAGSALIGVFLVFIVLLVRRQK